MSTNIGELNPVARCWGLKGVTISHPKADISPLLISAFGCNKINTSFNNVTFV